MTRRTEGEKTVASNRRARHDYAIQGTLEAGIQLTGDEVKSLRGGRASLTDCYARVRDGEAWLEGLHIPPYEQGDVKHHLPTRPRKLLLHRREITKWRSKVEQRGFTMVPLKLYLKNNRAKVEIALVRGKHTYDKREAIAQRDSERDLRRELKEASR